MSYWLIEIEVPSDLSEWLSWLLAERLEVAVELQDDETLTTGPSQEMSRLLIRKERAPDSSWIQRIQECLTEVGQDEAQVRSRHEEDDSWRLGWRAFFKPTEVASGVMVRPPWSSPSAARVEVVIDPGLAFGTGTHATTQLAAWLLNDHLSSPQVRERDTSLRVLDQGCGSGILSLIAAAEGHEVIGVEIDPVAAQNARENIALNPSISGTVEIEARATLPERPFDLVVMNIIAPVLIELVEQLRVIERKSPPELTLILSGLREEQELDVLEAYAGWAVVKRECRDSWVGLILRQDLTSPTRHESPNSMDSR